MITQGKNKQSSTRQSVRHQLQGIKKDPYHLRRTWTLSLSSSCSLWILLSCFSLLLKIKTSKWRAYRLFSEKNRIGKRTILSDNRYGNGPLATKKTKLVIFLFVDLLHAHMHSCTQCAVTRLPLVSQFVCLPFSSPARRSLIICCCF